MFEARFAEAKNLTLGVGAVNVAFTLVAVSARLISQPSEVLSWSWWQDNGGVVFRTCRLVFCYCSSS